MADANIKTTADNAVHRRPEVEHFLNLNTILHSLVDFIRPETYIAQDELQTYNELKEKFLHHEEVAKRTKGQTSKSPLEIAGVQSIRTTSGIYRFLAHHQSTKTNGSTVNNKQKAKTTLTREELLKKLHSKMPHRQQQAENGTDQSAKRKRTKDENKDRQKKPRTMTKEWTAPSSNSSETKSSTLQPATVPTQLTFGRFDFNTDDSPFTDSKKKKQKKFQTKQKQLINTLKKVESERDELTRLQEENPEEGKELLRSKHWKTALAKAKGEKVRDDVHLLRKTIKKQSKLRQQSAKKWQHKKAETDKQMKARQNKRQENIQKRKDEKKAKIKKRLIKKGRLIS